MCGGLCGDIWEWMKGKENPCQFIWQGQVDDCSGNAIVWL